MDSERWKPIHGYEGRYEVSTSGLVRKISFTLLNPGMNTYGYKHVHLYKEGKATLRMVHSLVLETFVSPKPARYECSHINGIKMDNRLDNLQWVTHKENAVRGMELGEATKGSKNGRAILTENDVRHIKELLSKGSSPTELGRWYGVNYRTICDIKYGKKWTHV